MTTTLYKQFVNYNTLCKDIELAQSYRLSFRQEVIYSIRAAMRGGEIKAVHPHRPPGLTQLIVEGAKFYIAILGALKPLGTPVIYATMATIWSIVV